MGYAKVRRDLVPGLGFRRRADHAGHGNPGIANAGEASVKQVPGKPVGCLRIPANGVAEVRAEQNKTGSMIGKSPGA